MIIAGAGGHAKELLGILDSQGAVELKNLCFFDNTMDASHSVRGIFKVLHDFDEVKEHFATVDNRFILGIGKPAARDFFYHKFSSLGGIPYSVVAATAIIGKGVEIEGKGLNIMHYSVITEDVTIGIGALIHVHSSIHHDSSIGNFCELSPGSRILGKAKLGANCSIGTGAVLFPGVEVGDRTVIGAGAVVLKSLPSDSIAAGVPAKLIKASLK